MSEFESPNRKLSDRLRAEAGQTPIQERKGPRRKWITATEPNVYVGWTIVSAVPLDSAFIEPAHGLLRELREDYAPGEWSIHPLNSLHMTVFSGQTEWDLRDAGLPVRETLDTTTQKVTELRYAERPLKVRVVGFLFDEETATATVEPADEQTSADLTAFRDEVAEHTEFRRPDHDTVRFHITFAYRLTAPAEGSKFDREAKEREYTERLQAAGDIVLCRPVYSVFETMTSFPPTHQF